MRKQVLLVLGLIICSMSVMTVEAKIAKTPVVNNAIKLYKAKNYSGCYELLQSNVKNDPSNALAYYYLAMSAAQIGKKDEAIENYQKVINLAPNGQLGRYANKGKTCLEAPEMCHVDEQLDQDEAFIKSRYGTGFSEQVRSDYEKQKIENLMREMNRKENIDANQFREYRDFSSSVPTNDEIAQAIRVLQRAGMTDFTNGLSDLSMLTGRQNYENEALLNMLTGKKNSDTFSPQLIQSLLTSQMYTGF